MLSLYHKAQGATGSDTLKYPGVGIPMQFRGTLTHSVSPNAEGSNHNVRLKAVVPVARQVDGRWVSENAFIASFSFTALQSVVEDETRLAALDELLAHITAHKADILSGTLPGVDDYALIV